MTCDGLSDKGASDFILPLLSIKGIKCAQGDRDYLCSAADVSMLNTATKTGKGQKSREKRLHHETGQFPIWCDDFRPENVLVDRAENIIGVVDWEFTYIHYPCRVFPCTALVTSARKAGILAERLPQPVHTI